MHLSKLNIISFFLKTHVNSPKSTLLLRSQTRRWSLPAVILSKTTTRAFSLLSKCGYVVVQSQSCVWFFATPWTWAHQASLCLSLFLSFLTLISIELMMPSNHLIFCCPLLLLSLIFPRNRVFSNEWTLHIRWPKYWSFNFSISQWIFMVDFL